MTVRISVLVVVIAGCQCALAQAAPPTNVRLISAMPKQTESVAIWRFAEFPKAISLDSGMGTWPIPHPFDEDDWGGKVVAELTRDQPDVVAIGGSAFEAPPDLGVGNFKQRFIAYSQGGFGDLAASLEEAAGREDGPKKEVDGDWAIYSGRVGLSFYGGKRLKEQLLVAIFEDATFVVGAESEDELSEMLKGLGENLDGGLGEDQAEIPEQWKPMAKSVKLDSALLVLRVYRPVGSTKKARLLVGRPLGAELDGAAFWLAEPEGALQFLMLSGKASALKPKMESLLGDQPGNLREVEGGLRGELPLQRAEFLRQLIIFGSIPFI